MKFYLEHWGDGTFRLVHWDIMHGDDVVLEIKAGTAYKHTYDENENEIIVEEINLPAFLENLKTRCTRIEKRLPQ